MQKWIYAPRRTLSGSALEPRSVGWNRKTVVWKSERPFLNRPTLSATSASCLTVSWPGSDMSAGRWAPASTIYDGYGNSDVMWTSIPWTSWCPPSSSVDSTTAMQFCTGYLSTVSPLEPCNRSHTVTRLSPRDLVRPALKELLPVIYRPQYKVALLICSRHMTIAVPCIWVNPFNQQQQSSTSTSSFCQQTRLHCSTDKN